MSCARAQLKDMLLAGLYCACGGNSVNSNITHVANDICSERPVCWGICANPDVSGIGVRTAFYAQSVMNALLVFFSPRDSIPSAWAATCLVTALVIPALIQKLGQTLTLHHATLVFNFATLSCLSSLAVAPKLPIWRLRPGEYAFRELTRHQALHGINVLISAAPSQRSSRAPTPRVASPAPMRSRSRTLSPEPAIHRLQLDALQITHDTREKIRQAQSRERVLLSLALILQVALQWTWGIVLFVSPVYSQPECSGGTVLVLFFAPWRTRDIQTHGKSYSLHPVWPLWILFCLAVTLVATVMVAISGPSLAHDATLLSRQTTRTGSSISSIRAVRVPMNALSAKAWAERRGGVLGKVAEQFITAWTVLRDIDRSRKLIAAGYAIAFTLWLLFIIASERQIKANCIFAGEDVVQGFGQTAALLLALAPLWSLTVAMYKYPALKRRQERALRKRLIEEQQRDTAQEDIETGAIDHGLRHEGHRASPTHHRVPSSTSVVSEMAPLIDVEVPSGRLRRLPWAYDSDQDSD